MKMIFKIARTELRNLFYSPVAWFLTIAFMVQCAIFYTTMVFRFSKYQDMLVRNNPKFKDFGASITQMIFLNSDSIFQIVLQNLYLFVPLLTMGMISREINNGTIKLLYSSPVKLRSIVMGKYLAIMIYNLLLLTIVGVFMVTGILNIHKADYGLLLSGAFGFYLLLCAYTAIGMFMSSLTTYQIVSALGSFILIFVLSRIGGLWQKYDLVRDLTYFLSISGRTTKMLRGLITTNDVMYFVLIVYMFIGFTLFRLKGQRESKPWYKKAIRYLGVFASVLVIGYATSRPGYIGYWDTTAQDINTIHERTQKVVNQLGDEPLEVTLYSNLLGAGIQRGRPEHRNDYMWNLWEKYLRFKPNINFKYVYYYDVKDGDSGIYRSFPGKDLPYIAKEMADVFEANFSRWIGPKEIRKQIDLANENYRVVMQVKYKGKTAFLRTFDDPTFWPDETQVGAVLKRLSEPTGPKAYYVTGDLERSIHKTGEREFELHSIRKDARLALINHGYDFDTVSLDRQDIPADATIVVLADPKVELTATTLGKLKQYIDNGGNMLIQGEPGKQHVLNPVLQQLGIQAMPGTLVEITKNEMPHMVFPYVTRPTTWYADEDFLIALRNSPDDTARMLHPGAYGIGFSDTSGFKDTALLVTTANRKTWAKVGKLVTDSAPPVFTVEEGDYKRDSFATAVSLIRKIGGKEQRIIVCGDADWMSSVRGGGGDISRAFYCWLDNGRYPLYAPRPTPEDSKLTIKPTGAKTQEIVYTWVLPGLVLLLAIVLLVRRKRQ